MTTCGVCNGGGRIRKKTKTGQVFLMTCPVCKKPKKSKVEIRKETEARKGKA